MSRVGMQERMASMGALERNVRTIQNPDDGQMIEVVASNPATAFTVVTVLDGDRRIVFTDPTPAAPNPVVLSNLPSVNRLFVDDLLFEIVNIQFEPCRMMSEVEAAHLKLFEVEVQVSNSKIEPVDITRRLSTRMVDGGISNQGGIAANPTSLIQPGTGAAGDQLAFPRFIIKGNERVDITAVTDFAAGMRVDRVDPFSLTQAEGLPLKMRVDAIKLVPAGGRQAGATVFNTIPQPQRESAAVLNAAQQRR